jgi:hypothetical protein|nr:hypothetical protein [Kofleriaceae bacterium]
MIRSRALSLTLFVVAGCSSSPAPSSTPDAPPPLRPGVDDSSQAYQGTPDADETAFWTAVLAADDTGRAAAVQQLEADVGSDPSNGYSEFLIGASYFMPPTAVAQAIASGSDVPEFDLDGSGAAPILGEGLANLQDPFYLGFDGGLLGELELAHGDPSDGGPTFATAAMHNPAATGLIRVIGDLLQQQPQAALSDMYGLYEFCNGGAVDHAGGDAAAIVAKQNAGAMVHRECYSGFYAPHGTEGMMLVLGDLQAINGNGSAAQAYYAAVQQATGYATWPMQAVVQRRVSGAQAADPATVARITSTCATCHVTRL